VNREGKIVDLANAIKTAIDFETKVQKVYADAVERSEDETGRRVFQVLADEEKNHVAYLNSRLDEWRKTGTITVADLDTAVPPKDAIEKKTRDLKKQMLGHMKGTELDMLRKALGVETETSEFYQRMVDELSGEGKKMFARFVEIEEGHKAIVSAEIDAVSGTGHWFDFREFDLEQY
jgi:rubrerythrin